MCVQSRNIEIEATTLCSFLAVQSNRRFIESGQDCFRRNIPRLFVRSSSRDGFITATFATCYFAATTVTVLVYYRSVVCNLCTRDVDMTALAYRQADCLCLSVTHWFCYCVYS